MNGLVLLWIKTSQDDFEKVESYGSAMADHMCLSVFCLPVRNVSYRRSRYCKS